MSCEICGNLAIDQLLCCRRCDGIVCYLCEGSEAWKRRLPTCEHLMRTGIRVERELLRKSVKKGRAA